MSISPSSRVLVVPPDAESLDSISRAGLEKKGFALANMANEYSALIMDRTDLLVLTNVKLRLEQLQILCQTHNLQGYSRRRSRARELFLPCESGYIFNRSTANDTLVPRR
ncbi:BZ3500_MvSof-1268-A1-R1_Chr1-3g02179 [Microbotryum saponariae]|uniref:BZ3500_MvSof-1268-A1-R1_Chr1-3g02179 protein n=1 Tax=Microbotryum saponariae TaxID=289078 RepID=A0A2X0KP56_9BASI|nr:BZ3500_MvSof-1268-A1-R1_Chr1-3g02179 [Microbotryum saponariae]SCZ95582.1 BZ3501_MvSof-1269-A2-R1_Chr1-3g01782 [Microbotryum saponariae]